MLYYRIAWKNNQSSLWRWKSTKLTSLQTVFHFLRLHRAIPQDHLRVFSSSSCEGLKEILEEENQGRQQVSVSAEQFLRERGMHTGKMTAGASAQSGSGGRENQEKTAITATLPSFLNQSSAPEAAVEEPGLVQSPWRTRARRNSMASARGAMPDFAPALVEEKPISLLDRRRWERELGAGGDHDLAYTFALPPSLPQTLAWIRLLAKVQRGELEP